MTYVPQHKANLVIAAAAMTSPIPAPEAANGAGALRRVAPRLRRVSRRTLVLALLAAAVPVTVTAAVVELSNDPPPREAPLPTLGAGPDGRVVDRDPLPALPTAIGDAYARLARPATADDRDAATVRRFSAQAQRFGLAPGQARVMATRDGHRVWLMPGNGFLCIGVQAAGDGHMSTGCASEAKALRDGLNVSDTDNVYGLLPDGVHQIEVTDDNGFHHVESVIDNVYELPPVSATIRYQVGGAGSVSFRVIV
jgi:hypothetical protein